MKQAASLPVFLAVSVSLHLVPWMVWSGTGRQSAGGSGERSITLEAASSSLGVLVAEWSQPVAVKTSVDTPQPEPPAVETPPNAVSQPTSYQPKAHPAPTAIAALAPDLAPQPETTPPTAKPQDPAPKAATQPPPKPATSSREQAPEKARGQAQAAAGSGGAEQETTGNTKRQANLRKQWGAQILSRIERQKRNQSGTGDVRLKLVVHTSGKLQSVSLVRSSQNPTLDATALSIAKRAKPPRAPRKLVAGNYPFVLTVSFGR